MAMGGSVLVADDYEPTLLGLCTLLEARAIPCTRLETARRLSASRPRSFRTSSCWMS